jgi:folate-dependent phosphoribosylglycinamide formyltransferase PurN
VGIIEDRREWISATIHVVDEGIDTGTILWRGAPQLAPGDTAVMTCFRAHLEAVEALVRILEQ